MPEYAICISKAWSLNLISACSTKLAKGVRVNSQLERKRSTNLMTLI